MLIVFNSYMLQFTKIKFKNVVKSSHYSVYDQFCNFAAVTIVLS